MTCVCDHAFLEKWKIPKHTRCTKVEEEGIIYYTLYWPTHLTLFLQKDGPVTIIDCLASNLYKDIFQATGDLQEKLKRVTSI